MSSSHKRLLVFAVVFATAILIDAVKFLMVGKPTVVNWESFVHLAWVVGAVIVLFLASYFPLVHRIAFWVYLAIFATSYINIYVPFTETLTYFCMLFNLVLIGVYYFSNPKKEGI